MPTTPRRVAGQRRPMPSRRTPNDTPSDTPSDTPNDTPNDMKKASDQTAADQSVSVASDPGAQITASEEGTSATAQPKSDRADTARDIDQSTTAASDIDGTRAGTTQLGDDPEPDRDESPEISLQTAPPAPGPKTSRSARVVLSALLLAALGAGAWLTYLELRPAPKVRQPVISNSGVYTPGTIPSATGMQALQAAVADVPFVLAYDYRSLPAGLSTSLSKLTPQFAGQFNRTFTTTIEPVATKNKAVVQALVRAAGVSTVSNDSVSCLIFLDETLVQSGGSTSPQVSQDRIQVTMKRQGGHWLIDSITPF